jgi:hypothetical protein
VGGAEGPRHQRLALLRRRTLSVHGHPLEFAARQYANGVRWFDRETLERALGHRLHTRRGATELARAGFGLVRLDGAKVELRATDPRLALLVNRARLGPQRRRYDEHRVLEIVLSLPPKAKRRRPATDERRLDAAQVLLTEWLIECDDLLGCRPFVRLCSQWTFAAR